MTSWPDPGAGGAGAAARRPARGRLLVATPLLDDPNFTRTVVLLLEHGEDGAFGLVLNRPTELTLDDAVPDWRPVAAAPAVVFSGGPVSPEAVIALGRGPADAGDGWIAVAGDLGTVDIGCPPGAAGAPVRALRVFAGYAGWAGGQLEAEIAEGAWFVVDADPDDAFTTRPARLWRDVLRRQRGRIALFASYPDDPDTN